MMEDAYLAQVGFIGLGAMGKHMAERLAVNLPPDSKLFVYDVVEAPMNDLVAKYPGRVFASTSPRGVTENTRFLISMVPEGSHVRSVYLDDKSGVCSVDLEDRILIDCSTIDLPTSLEVKEHIAARNPGAFFYDAPVSGGTLGAEKGTIAFFLGCAPTDAKLDLLSKILCTMGSKVIPCGGFSAGLASKLCNNYLSGLIAIASSEALNMGIKAGLDPRVLSSVFAAGTAQNAICDRFNPCPGVVPDAPSSKGYQGGFKVQLMKKDFSLAVDLANTVGARLVLGEQGLDVFTSASNDSQCRDRDSRVVFRWIGGDEDWSARAFE